MTVIPDMRRVRVAVASADSIIAAARQPGGTTSAVNPNWAAAGVEGGIPVVTTKHGDTITAYTGTAATINTAIDGANAAGGGIIRYVELGAGTFSLSTSIVLKTNVVLRGQGMSTIISFTNMGGSGYYWGAGEVGILVSGAYNSVGDGSPPAYGGYPTGNIKTWNGCGGSAGSFPHGATVLDLASAPSGLSVGDMLTLWQENDSDGSVPKSGYLVSYKTDAGSAGISWFGGGEGQSTSQQQRVRVTNISGSQVTVTPGLYLPSGTWRSGQNPKVGWQGSDIRSAGLEDLLIKSTAYTSAQWGLVDFWQASNCWMTRCGLQPRTGAHQAGNTIQAVVHLFETRNITIFSNWFDTAVGGAFGSSTSYGVEMLMDSASLIENNIFNGIDSPIMYESSAGSVVAYNFENVGAETENGWQCHDSYPYMSLTEGNSTYKFMAATFHGNANFMTVWRNHFFGSSSSIDLWSYNRYWNVIGNVIASPAIYKSLATDATKYSRFGIPNDGGAGVRLGYPQQNASSATTQGVALDAEVWETLFLWGNYSEADTSNHFHSTEVTPSDSTYPNTVPASQTLSTSLFRATRPGYFTLSSPISVTVAWPPIGPDVTGGTISGLGGHANKLPAQLVFEQASGVVASFTPSLYGS